MKERYFGREITHISNIQIRNRQSTFDSKRLNQKTRKASVSSKFDHLNLEKTLHIKKTQYTDPQFVKDYINDIFKHIITKQNSYELFNFKKSNKVLITFQDRCKIVDYIIQNHQKLKLFPQTLFIAVWILDKSIMQGFNIKKSYYNSFGIIVLFIAAKYQQTYRIPKIKDLYGKTGIMLNENEILDVQGKIIQLLGFNLTIQTPYFFLDALGRREQFPKKYFYLAQYILELSLFNENIFQYKQSLIGCSAFYIANKLIDLSHPWPQQLELQTGYSQREIEICAKNLFAYYEDSFSSPYISSVKRKFSIGQFEQVTNLKFEKKTIFGS